MNNKDYADVCSTCDVLTANPKFDKSWIKKKQPSDSKE